MSADWPLRGRADELGAISDALAHSGGVLLAGPAGVGKTRLAVESLAAHRRPGRLVRATASSCSIPLGALAPLIGIGGAGRVDVDMLARAHNALRAEPRTALGIDDAHLLDGISATVVHQLAAERAVPLVVTVRAGEPAPAAVTALWKDGLLPRVDVAPLTSAGTAALLEAALGGPVAETTTRRLHAATAGNVLWLRHLVLGEVAAGRLACRQGVRTWSGEPQLTPALAELIDDQIGELDDGVRPVVELLALGEPLDVTVLAALTGPANVDEAIKRQLVNVTGGGSHAEARLTHPLYGEAVRARIGELRARRLRGTLALALRDVAPDEVLRWASLAVDSDLEPDPKLLVAASELAIQLTDMDLGVRLLEIACAAGAGFEAHLTLAFTLSYVIRPHDAERVLRNVAALALTDRQRARATQVRVLNLALMIDDVEQARAVLDEAEGHSGRAVDLLGVRALLDATGDRFPAAEASAGRVLASADPPAHAAAMALWALTLVTGFRGRADALTGVAERARAAAAASPETASLRMNITLIEIFGLWLAGHPDQIRRRIDRLIRELAGRFATLYVPAFEGVHALTTGQAILAARRLREFRSFHSGRGGGYTAWMEGLIGIACGMAGDAAGAREALLRAEEFRHPAVMMVGPQFELTRAWAAAAEGAITAATRSAVAAAELAAASGQWAVEVLARHTAVGFGDHDQAGRLRELTGLVDGPRAAIAAAHAESLAAEDPDALLAVSARSQAAGLLATAAEAAAQAASLLHRRGPAARAVDASRRSLAIAGDCGLYTPAIAAIDRPSPLSDRQREIAALAARLTNAEIAEQLGVSVRTVEGHIYHACVRLGLANRTQLADFVTQAGRTS